ncbi:MAG: hypothetical protein PVJ53_02885 [Desulfobacterales bacterium]
MTCSGGRPRTLGKAKAALRVYDHQGQSAAQFRGPSARMAFNWTPGRYYRLKDAPHQMDLWRGDDLVCVIGQWLSSSGAA